MHCNRSVFGNLRPHQCHAENGGEITYFEYVSETQQQAQDSRTCNLLMCTLWKKHEIAISYSSEGDLCLQLMLWDANAVIIRNKINLEKKNTKQPCSLYVKYKECICISCMTEFKKSIHHSKYEHRKCHSTLYRFYSKQRQ